MQIISHRGFWTDESEKNTVSAFRRAFTMDFGVETDFRDRNGHLVISHDPPNNEALTAEAFFEIYHESGCRSPLALNIKADGLQGLLCELLDGHGIDNYFVFDMSVPDALAYHRGGFCTFTRQSEWEPQPSFYAEAHGVWMDTFISDWIDETSVDGHLREGKRVCLVSPELHRRNHLSFWNRLKEMECLCDDRLMLCTDYPEDARRYFHGQN